MTLLDRLNPSPRVADRREAQRRLAHFLDDAKDTPLPALVAAHPALHDLLLALADHSPFLFGLIERDPERCVALLQSDPDERTASLLQQARNAWRDTDETHLLRQLRKIKQEIALLAALADCGGLWPLEKVTGALAGLADASVAAALDFALHEAAQAGKFSPHDPLNPSLGSGAVVLALGKHGAQELNYSSDIDIVFFYNPEKAPLSETIEPTPFFVRVVKFIVKALQERTADGYVFRVDLRLRPDPASTPTAVPVQSAYAYYETVGQNWERAAYIKARPIAGDIAIGEEFIADLKPFIWRKYFDFAAIADIHAMKRQIHAVKGHEAIAVAGHDIKLGRGGIREIEFFVQTQQLVFGGRRPELRGRQTLTMLRALKEDGWIGEDADRELEIAYRFLRTIEHRLQMMADEQTQRLPVDEDALTRFAKFAGYASLKSFSAALTKQARAVERHYARLFEEGADLASEQGSLVFTGTQDDPETLETLTRMGFKDAPKTCETVRGWHFGRRQAVTSARAREVLTELVPTLLEAFGKSADPDNALAVFDDALGRMPAAIELFSILKSRRAVLTLFADILGSAPRLANFVANRPHLLDAVIDPAFGTQFGDVTNLERRLKDAVGEPDLLEDMLDRLREAGQHEIFLVGARMLSGSLSPALAGQAYADVAEAIIRVALSDVTRRFESEYGKVPGGRLCVVGMGRLGSREMTATSDLDLVVLYDFHDEQAESLGGARSLAATTYFTRLTQRLISALTVPTRKGVLYEVDMRLRPSGNKGPAATQWKGFRAYQAEEAETWEEMALTRARPLAGDQDFIADVRAELHAIMTRPRKADKVKHDAFTMRALIAQEKGDEDPWDLKLAKGGLMDIEFIAQMLVLTGAAHHPSIAVTSTAEIIARARKAGLMGENDGETLESAYNLMRDVFQWQRLTFGAEFHPDQIGAALKTRLAQAAGLPDFRVLASHLNDTRSAVRSIFTKMMQS